MTNKMTKKDYFYQIYALVENNLELPENEKNDLLTFVEHELDLLERKNARKSDKPTRKQIGNALKAQEILAFMAENKKYYTASELASLSGMSFQKITALIKGQASREIYKGHALYYVGEKPTEYPVFKKTNKKEAE
jgi:hypothetical protein